MSTSVTHLLAVDLGAESGRVIRGTFSDDRLQCEEVHRFANGGVRVHDHLYWDVLRIYDEIKTAIAKASSVTSRPFAGLAIDSWAVDFGLVGRSGELLGGVHHYRDPRTDGVMERFFARMPAEDIYRQTGVQFLQFNTLYQLFALRESEPEVLAAADNLLMIGELLTYFLTGERVSEFTNATTTQMFDPASMSWSRPLFEALGLPMELMPQVVGPGTRVGSLLSSVAEETGAAPIDVLVPAVHDTGSAVAAVPAMGDNWAFISSGTWSLVGLELPQPIITEKSRELNISNEGGVAGTFRCLKNVMGLWLLQRCRQEWSREGGTLDYGTLAHLASEASPHQAFIDPDDPRFFQPDNMPEMIIGYLQETGQPFPTTRGALVRCILESLALKYRLVLDQLLLVSGREVDVIHIVGGGAKNDLLNQMTADATGRTVIAGPYEATSIGNLAMQAVGLGLVESITAARALVRRSFDVQVYQPREKDRWEAAYQRFLQIFA